TAVGKGRTGVTVRPVAGSPDRTAPCSPRAAPAPSWAAQPCRSGVGWPAPGGPGWTGTHWCCWTARARNSAAWSGTDPRPGPSHAEHLPPGIQPEDLHLAVAVGGPALAGEPQQDLVPDHAFYRHPPDAVLLVPERAGHPQRRQVPGVGAGVGGHRAQAGERQVEHCCPHLLTEALALEALAQPGSGVDFP